MLCSFLPIHWEGKTLTPFMLHTCFPKILVAKNAVWTVGAGFTPIMSMAFVDFPSAMHYNYQVIKSYDAFGKIVW